MSSFLLSMLSYMTGKVLTVIFSFSLIKTNGLYSVLCNAIFMWG